jgi:RNA binding exosome subunit
MRLNLENRVYHDQEGNKGSFFDINISILKKRLMSAKNIKQFFKEIIATLDDVDQLYIFDLQKQNQITRSRVKNLNCRVN